MLARMIEEVQIDADVLVDGAAGEVAELAETYKRTLEDMRTLLEHIG